MSELSNPPSVTLDNCDQEPIHIPGSIQPTGALLAFDSSSTLMSWSANCVAMLGLHPAAGNTLADLDLDEEPRRIIRECLSEMRDDALLPLATDILIGGRRFDLIVHAYQERTIAEFELKPGVGDQTGVFAQKAHRAIDRIKRQNTLEKLLEQAVQDVRALTGFDRVMGYRFRHDDSGDIVAEDCREDLEPYLGRRYPASDIPAQARRLYTINTLRLISDINYQPVPLLGWTQDTLDLSHAVLRSVSPIHIEYLQNMGVAASMSVSIVVEGRLWGMIACHHMSPRQVPFDVRMTCDVLAQVIAANVQALEGRLRAQRVETAAITRAALVESLLQEDDLLRAIDTHADSLCTSLGAEAAILTQFGKVVTHGELSPGLAQDIAQSLEQESQAIVERTERSQWSPELKSLIGPWVGMLALRFDPGTRGALIFLRREQLQTIRWGGKPEKTIRVGPLGPRLTPRGSFTEWQEVVRDRAQPWDEIALAAARQLFAEMQRVCNARHSEVERARSHLLAMLGHDLRDPLQSISMAATVMGRRAPEEPLSKRIKASSNRMQRLIEIVLDVSRIESGMGLGIARQRADLSGVIADLIDEQRVAHDGVVYETTIPASLIADVDPARVSQLISNLLSNARHHGLPGRPIRLTLEQRGNRAFIEVHNEGAAIEPSVEANLFSAFKATSLRNTSNPTGLGLGLHIARAIAREHDGTLSYRYSAPWVIFSAEIALPTAVPAA